MFDEHENFDWVDKNYFVLIINSFNLINYSQQAFHKVLSSLQNRHVQDIKTPPFLSRYVLWCTIKFLDGGQEVT